MCSISICCGPAMIAARIVFVVGLLVTVMLPLATSCPRSYRPVLGNCRHHRRKRTFLGQPIGQAFQAFLHSHAGLPPGIPLKFSGVGDVVALVAGSPGVELDSGLLP